MRSIVLLVALIFVSAALAVKDDVACVVHSDDCGKCLSNGCNWCSDGYCVSKESDICEAHKVATACPVSSPVVVPAAADRAARRLNGTICESATNCAQCASLAGDGCFVCIDSVTKLTKCSTTPQCVAPNYNARYEWWIELLHLNLNFTLQDGCPVNFPAAPNSPTLAFVIPVLIFTGITSANIDDLPESYVKAQVLAVLYNIIPASFLNGRAIIIISVTFRNSDKRDAFQNAEVLLKFADVGQLSAQGIAATLVAEQPAQFELAKGSEPINVEPFTPGTGTTGAQVTPRGGNSDDDNLDLSKGALAGIIIGSIIGGALIIALIVWFVLRRRDAYPQAFRSPAAAYRP